MLNLLIENYNAENNTFDDADPIELLKSLMKDHKMIAIDLTKLLDASEGLVSDILNYKKDLSKETIRILSERFKVNQDGNSFLNSSPEFSTILILLPIRLRGECKIFCVTAILPSFLRTYSGSNVYHASFGCKRLIWLQKKC